MARPKFIGALGRYAKIAGLVAALGYFTVREALSQESFLRENFGYSTERRIELKADERLGLGSHGLRNDLKFLLDYRNCDSCGTWRLGAEHFLDTEGGNNVSLYAGIPIKEARVQFYGDENGYEGKFTVPMGKTVDISLGFYEKGELEIWKRRSNYAGVNFTVKDIEENPSNNFGGGFDFRAVVDRIGRKSEIIGYYGFLKLMGIFGGYGRSKDDEGRKEHRAVIGYPGDGSFAARYLMVDGEGSDMHSLIITPEEIGLSDTDFISPLQDDILYLPGSAAIPETNPNRFDNYDLNSRVKNWGLGLTYTSEDTDSVKRQAIEAEFVKYLTDRMWLGGSCMKGILGTEEAEARAELGYTPASFYDLEKRGPPSIRLDIGYGTNGPSVALRAIRVF